MGQDTVEDDFSHEPVMLAEVVELFASPGRGTLVDATVGGAGHAVALLDAYPDLQVIGLDQDPAAVRAATRRLAPFGKRAVVVRARFDRLAEVLTDLGRPQVDGVLFDLGVSSPQLDRAERGFSYRAEAPLDMRMDQASSRTAATVVNDWDEVALRRLLVEHGEARFAGRIAKAIVAARPLRTTTELAEVVRSAIPAPARRRGGHPARRTFQAIRVAVNEELDILPRALEAALDRLADGGRCVVLSYHSGEDRIVKATFTEAATGGCSCPPGLPCACGAQPTARLLNRGARKPQPAEVARNPRSESARLRAVERLRSSSADGSVTTDESTGSERPQR